MKKTVAVLSLTLVVCAGCADRTALPSDLEDLAPSMSVAMSAATVSAPVFGLGTGPDGSVMAAETFAGITELRKQGTDLVAALVGVSGVAAVGRGDVFAVTGADELGPGIAPNDRKLFRISRGGVRLIADLGAYEESVNPDQIWNPGAPDSNPFNVAVLSGGSVLVSDAAGNDILAVDARGSIDWVAVLTPRPVATGPYKALIGCPGSNAPDCGLPDQIPAQPVATSIAVGPDGAYYAGELTGFPGAPGNARIWRIAPGSRHVMCPSTDCTLVSDGFTSIISLAFGPDGTLYVAEFDEDGWLGVEIGAQGGPLVPSAGGTVSACDVSTGSCDVLASGLSLPAAVAVDARGTVWVAENESIPGSASVHPIS